MSAAIATTRATSWRMCNRTGIADLLGVLNQWVRAQITSTELAGRPCLTENERRRTSRGNHVRAHTQRFVYADVMSARALRRLLVLAFVASGCGQAATAESPAPLPTHQAPSTPPPRTLTRCSYGKGARDCEGHAFRYGGVGVCFAGDDSDPCVTVLARARITVERGRGDDGLLGAANVLLLCAAGKSLHVRIGFDSFREGVTYTGGDIRAHRGALDMHVTGGTPAEDECIESALSHLRPRDVHALPLGLELELTKF